MPAPLPDMENLRPVDFDAALPYLHGWIGSKVKATVNLYGQFFGCGMAGELARVEFLPPDRRAISLVFEQGDGVFLDPDDTQVYVGAGEGSEFLEFHARYGVSLLIEPDRPESRG